MYKTNFCRSKLSRWSYRLLLLGSTLTLLGCSNGPARVNGVSLDAAATAESLVSRLDKDASGDLSLEEVKTSPSLADHFAKYDLNSDAALSADELEATFVRVFDPKLGLCTVDCVVTRNGRGLANAGSVPNLVKTKKVVSR